MQCSKQTKKHQGADFCLTRQSTLDLVPLKKLFTAWFVKLSNRNVSVSSITDAGSRVQRLSASYRSLLKGVTGSIRFIVRQSRMKVIPLRRLEVLM